MTIVSIVDKPKWGLLGHASALQAALTRSGRDGRVLAHRAFSTDDAFPVMGSLFGEVLRRSKPGDHLILWSLGTAFVLAPVWRMLGRRTVYVYHEPATLKERIRKSGDVLKSVVTAVLLAMLMPLCTRVVVPNRTNARQLRLPYVPLPIDPTPVAPDRHAPLHVVFLGARLPTRSIALFQAVAEAAGRRHPEWRFSLFPGSGGASETDKAALLADGQVVIWNLFTIPYNQSGVTLDALKYGLPLLITDHEPLRAELRSRNIAEVLDSSHLDVSGVLETLGRIESKHADMAAAARSLAVEWFNPRALADAWLEALES